MKVRLGFVSNSSSSSFILDKRYLTPNDIEQINEHSNCDEHCEYWNITEDDDFLRGFTTMDNEYLYNWVKQNLNIPLNAVVSWE